MRRRIPAALTAFGLLSACGTPIAGDDTERAPVIAGADRVQGSRAHPQLLAEFGGAYPGEESAYVRTVGERVGAAAGLPGQCTFTLVNSDVVNAFAVPGCYIYVTRGLLAIVGSEAELASVLGHEVGHIVARHAQAQERRTIWTTLGVVAASVTGSQRLTRLASQAGQYFGLRYSRRQEYQADDLSVRYLRRAGYDVFASAQMLGGLERNDAFLARTRGGGGDARRVPEWTLSHPLTARRIERARTAAIRTGLSDDQQPENRNRYLAAVDGLLYGDDPQQGFVIGRRFAHPVMRIGFTAPDGFALTNSPRAIGITGPDGVSGEFGGAALVGPSLSDHARALAARIVGDTPARVIDEQAMVVNGVPAVVTQLRVAVRDGEVPLAIAAYDGGDGQAYHFIIVSPPDDVAASRIAALFASFRRLSTAEAATLRPRYVTTVTVGPGDSAATLARRIADPAPAALFDLLNARTSGRDVAPGEVVKLVTYQGG